jgi:predicted membrane protein
MDYTLMFVLGVVITVCVMWDNRENGYKNGQIDALNGIIKYELVRQDDNSTMWVNK